MFANPDNFVTDLDQEFDHLYSPAERAYRVRQRAYLKQFAKEFAARLDADVSRARANRQAARRPAARAAQNISSPSPQAVQPVQPVPQNNILRRLFGWLVLPILRAYCEHHGMQLKPRAIRLSSAR